MSLFPRAVATAQVLALIATLAYAAGCATDAENDDGGTSDDTTSTATGGGGGGGGGAVGGSGGKSLCEQDCSTIETPQCLQGVCNEGQYPGTVGECAVVPAEARTPCDDGVFCTVNDTCDADGMCIGGPMNTCDLDPPPCTAITCVEETRSCTTAPAQDGASCESLELCVVNATCKGGECYGSPKDCSFSPLTECNQVACNPANGKCEGTADAAKDGHPCSLSGDGCLVGKTCSAGMCEGGTPKDCSALTVGCVNGVCDTATGICKAEPVAAGGSCLEGTDQCNSGLCDNNGNCQPMPLANGTPCNDYNSCTQSDSCNAGACDGSPVSGCTVYFQDGFESCPNGWSFGGDWECGTPSQVGPSAHSGTGVLATVLDADYNPNQSFTTTIATSPEIDLDVATEPKAGFWMWIHTEGSTYDGVNLKVSNNGGATYTLLTAVDPPYDLTVNGEQAWGGDLSADGWHFVVADLSAYAGQAVRLRFAFRSDSSIQKPGVYIDDISVAEAAAIPLAITSPSPVADAFVGQAYSNQLAKAGGSSGAVWSIVGGTNHGWLSLSPSGLLSGTPSAANAGPGNVVVRVAEPSLPSNFIEKTLAFTVAHLVYMQNFEGACPNGWTLTGDWQCGVPTTVGPAAAFSGTKVLATQIAANYSNGQTWAGANATSPSIDLTGISNAKLSFRVWMNTEGSSFDGFNLKVSTNGGASYAVVTTVTPAYPLTIDAQPAWGEDESSFGWQVYEANLSAYSGPIMLRFGFRSDGSISYPGVYIDDVIVGY